MMDFKKKIFKIFVILFSSLFLFSCNQFASEKDKAMVMYAYDSSFEDKYFLNGTTKYGVLNDEEIKKIEEKSLNYELINKDKKFYKWQECNDSNLLKEIKQKAKENEIIVPDDRYWFLLDDFLLKETIKETIKRDGFNEKEKYKEYSENIDKYQGYLQDFGYIKYFNNFAKMHQWKEEIEQKENLKLGTDFEKLYEEIIQKKIENISSYISLKKDTLYGNFGYSNKNRVYLEPKNWSSFKFSSFDFIFVYPITYLIEKLTFKFGNSSLAKILSIFSVVFIIKLITMLLFSIKAGVDQQKIRILHGELAKIKEKFSNYDKEIQKKFFAQEQKKIFKKNNISVFFITIDTIFKIISFIFISSAIKASAILSTGSFFNLFFNKSIKDAIFQKPAISNGWLTGLIIFLVMVLMQTLSIKTSNFFQKKISRKYNSNAVLTSKNKNFMPYILFSIITIAGFFLSINISIYIMCISCLDMVQALVIYLITSRIKRDN